MQKIPLKLAKSGMVLGKPVTKENGMVLLAQGTELTQAAIERLEHLKVERIVVEGEVLDVGAASPNSDYLRILEGLDRVFRKHEQDPWMQKLKIAFKQYFQLKAAVAGNGTESGSSGE